MIQGQPLFYSITFTLLMMSGSSCETAVTYMGGLGGKKWPGSYCQTGPLNTRHAAHSMHRTYRPVSGLLGKIPIHLTLFWMITNKLHHLCFFFLNNIWIHQFAWMDTWNKMILAIVTLQGR